tara:strand:- start:1877 stop:2347 length:471 start_codon:yes stop_codon:yes gene_type:complete
MTTSQKEKKAEQLYNHVLTKQIYPLTGDKSTFMNDLDRVGRKLLGIKFKGVFPSDKIPKLNDLKPYCILNLDKSTESGSHWIALAKIHGKNSSLVYDTFGRANKKIIPDLQYSGNGRIHDTDRDVEQKITQEDCGARSLAFLVVLDKYGVDVAKLI